MDNKAKLLKQLETLKQNIRIHDNFYYNLDRPQISDFEYDNLLKKLYEIEKKHPELKSPDSPSQKIPGRPLSHFKKKAHTKAMLSLQNSYSIEDIKAFYNRALKGLKLDRLDFFLEPKLDGMAVELIYENGLFSQALSRGDGQIGEEISAQVKTIRNLPLSLKKSDKLPCLEVRGELLILKKDFERINQEQELAGLPPFANPRNLSAGSVRQLDPKITASRPLKCFIHSLGGVDLSFLKTQEEFIKQMQVFGLPVFRAAKKLKAPFDLCSVAHSLEDVLSYYKQMQELRTKLPFEIDGIVIKINKFEHQKKLGEIARNPRWAMAGKFEPEQGETLLKKIKLQVGRTGVITPVAVLEALNLGGVSVRQASLHNFKWLKKKDIREGDKVLVHRAGDVIPEIIKSLKRSKRSQSFKAPKQCPVCKHPAQEQGDYLFCNFPLCPAVIENKLIHFCSKKAMNIEFLGEKSIKRFYEWGWLKNYSDIYDLKDKNLIEKEGFGLKSYKLLLESLEKSKKISLNRLIFALGIPLIGEKTAQIISQCIYEKRKDLDLPTAVSLLEALSIEELETIKDIGPLAAKSFKSAFEKKELLEDLKGLCQRGLYLSQSRKDSLKGLSFVITGRLPRPRLELQAKIENLGGTVNSQVSSQTSFLIAGEKPGAKKQKALSLSIPILDYEDFLNRFFRVI